MAQPENASHAKIRCRTIIEVLGKPKEHVEKTIRDYVKKIREDTDFVILSEHFSDASEQENGYSSVFVEIEILSKGLTPLVGFCFTYMPSSIEIEKPEEMVLPTHMVNALFNDLQARLHKVDMVVKQEASASNFLRRNLRHAIRNLVSITVAVQPSSLENLAKVTGVEKEHLKPILDELVTQGKLKHDGENYSLAK